MHGEGGGQATEPVAKEESGAAGPLTTVETGLATAAQTDTSFLWAAFPSFDSFREHRSRNETKRRPPIPIPIILQPTYLRKKYKRGSTCGEDISFSAHYKAPPSEPFCKALVAHNPSILSIARTGALHFGICAGRVAGISAVSPSCFPS